MTETTRPPSRRLNREVLALAVPSFLSTVSVPLLGIVDTALVGHLGQVALIGAVSVGAVIFDTVYWAFGFLRMGTTGLVAQAYGAGDDRRAGETLLQSTLIGCIGGVVLVAVREPLARIGLRLAGGSDEVTDWARVYITIRIFAAPGVLATYALNGFFRGMKDAITPLIVTLVVHTTNVVLDFALIQGRFGAPQLGVAGAAWASLIAVMAGLVTAAAVAWYRYRHTWQPVLGHVFASLEVWNGERLRELVATHVNLFGRTLILLAAYFLMVASAARMGEVALAANAIVLQLWHLSSYSVDGFAFAAETLVGNALGARRPDLARSVTRCSLAWGVGLGLLFALIYAIGLPTIAALFTPNPEVIAAVVALAAVTAIAQPLNAVAFIFDGVFIGARDMAYLFAQMAASFSLAFLPGLYFLVHRFDLGLAGLWITMLLFMVARALTLGGRYLIRPWPAASPPS